MKILITGNKDKDLCAEIVPLLERDGHECLCVSRETGYDFKDDSGHVIHEILKLAQDVDVFINLYANYFFNATILAHKLYNQWLEKAYSERRIINIGSTTDRVKKGKNNLYHYEKLALRDWSSGFALMGVWNQGPKVTHISFGTMENRAKDNPGRKCLNMKKAAEYVQWVLNQPKELSINELSVDPVQ
jgi:short-subunit dehydrogenase